MLSTLGRLISAPIFRRPIIVVGASRSGTSVLLQALGKHPLIYALRGEAPFLTSMGGAAHLFEHGQGRKYYMESLKTSKEYLFEQLRRLGFEAAAGPNYGLRRLGADMFSRSGSPLGRHYWGAKTFPTEPVAGGLISLYPEIKFIYIVRNGADVVQSRTKFEGFRHGEFHQHCLAWAESAAKFRYLTQMPQCHATTHERLLADPSTFFTSLLRDLNLPQNPGPAQYAATTLVHPLDQGTRAGTDVALALAEREPPHLSWTDDQRAVFKDLCGPAMNELGYEMPF